MGLLVGEANLQRRRQAMCAVGGGPTVAIRLCLLATRGEEAADGGTLIVHPWQSTGDLEVIPVGRGDPMAWAAVRQSG